MNEYMYAKSGCEPLEARLTDFEKMKKIENALANYQTALREYGDAYKDHIPNNLDAYAAHVLRIVASAFDDKLHTGCDYCKIEKKL